MTDPHQQIYWMAKAEADINVLFKCRNHNELAEVTFSPAFF